MALLGVAVIAATLLLFSLLLWSLARSSVPRNQDAALRRRVEQARAFVLQAPAADLQPHRVPAAVDLRDSTDVFVAVLGTDGRALTSSGEVDGAAPLVPPSVLARAGNVSAIATFDPVPGEP